MSDVSSSTGGRGAVAATIGDWVEVEFLPWRDGQAGGQDILTDVIDHVAQDPSVFHFSIRGQTVKFHEKAAEVMAAHYPAGSDYATIRARGFAYEGFFQSIVEIYDIRGDADMAVALGDLTGQGAMVPILAFQKVLGSTNILIPDIDFIDFDFYLAAKFQDPFELASKAGAAIFVGSTTGYQPIYRQMVENLDHQRLRSAVYFKNNSRIKYELPIITQCDSPETEGLIRDLGVGTEKRSWSEQLSNKYIISVDGNGATCSRVAIALKSNSVLIKYHSKNLLYYFSGLRTFIDFIDIYDDRDLENVVEMLEKNESLSETMALNSRIFYREYLSRISILQYAAGVLRRYVVRFGNADTASVERTNEAVFAIDSFAHVQNVGDVWSTFDGEAGEAFGFPIEGFELHPGPEIAGADLSYRSVSVDGAVSDPVNAWEYCGTRSEARPLSGIVVDLDGESMRRFDLFYEASFMDGSRSDLMSAGSICAHPDGVPMTSFRILTRRRLI